MPRPSKSLTRENTLRTTNDERRILLDEQKWYAENGLTLSLNDVVRALIRRATVPVPLTKAEATEAVRAHSAACPVCESTKPPACPDGLYIRLLYARTLQAPEPPRPAPRRTVSGRTPILPPPPS